MKRRCEETVPLLGPWLDGELLDEDRVWVEEHVSECDACGRRKALLAAARDAIRESVARRGASADLSRVADAVLARIEKDRGADNVVRLRVWATEMWRAHRSGVVAAGTLAAAACVAIAVLLSPFRAAPRHEVTLLADARPLTTLEQIDFENHEGAVMQSGDTTVIWIDDDTPAVPQ
ncbi:MAG TPA: zf-HC2 domain-containing protein [Myxococcales bacterium]|jgi:anti-sigma factor RsiW|nr:zf-HC2 domain-containing protein [Myxococcales bacterium]